LVTVMLAPGLPLSPLIVGLLLLVAGDPLVGDVMRGAVGAVASTLKVTAADAGPVLPAGSVSVAVIVWLPSPSGAVGAHVQEPSDWIVAVHNVVPVSLSFTATVPPASLGSLVPANVGLLLLVGGSLFVGDVTTGAAGGVVSTGMVTGVDGCDVPFGSAWVAVRVFVPSGRVPCGWQDHEPSFWTVAVQTVCGVPPLFELATVTV